MQIQSINFLNFPPKSKITPRKQIVFNGLIGDIFQFSSDNIDKKVTVKDLKGNSVKAVISKTTPCVMKSSNYLKKFTIYIDNKEKGHLTLDGCNADSLFMSHLSTQRNPYRKYKGLGTELLKCAVEESKRKGKHGAITTCAYYGQEAPFIFYFKNNFKITDGDSIDIDYPCLYNAPLQYAMKYNLNPFELIPKDYNMFDMKLDEKGAQALLEGKRLADSRICDSIATTIIDDELYSAQFIESPYEDEYFLQVLNEDMEEEKLCYVASLKPFEGEDGQKHFKIDEILNWFEASSDMVDDFAQSLIPELEKKYL